MGCDGGTIPRRDELVKTKKKAETKDKDSELAFQWRCCHLSQQTLQFPIVMCGLGNLYNKIALIEGLLNRPTLPESVRHVKSLKDVKNLNFTPNPEYKPGDEKKEGGFDARAVPHICPVTRLEMSGKHRFVGLWSCGCVFSERALKEISTTICHKCQVPFKDEDVVVLNGNEDDVEAMRARMENRQKRTTKRKKEKVESETVVKANVNSETKPSTSAMNPPKPVSGAIVVPELPVKRGGADMLNERVKKVKREYSVAKDPQASDVYKSLFTTHQSEKQQNRAHWITYNPFYN